MQALTGGRGVDYAFEVIGLPRPSLQAFNMARNGGTAVAVGMPRFEPSIDDPDASRSFFGEKTLLGCVYGSAQVRRDFPRSSSLVETGRLDLGVDGLADDHARRRQRRLPGDGGRRGHPQRHRLTGPQARAPGRVQVVTMR